MAQEIERKFLLQNDTWREGVQGLRLVQGYLSSVKERIVRVRIAGEEAFLTIKGAPDGIACLEYEYSIPPADAEVLLQSLAEQPLIEKIRYTVPHAGAVWEIDEFLGENIGLLIAEIELTSVTQQFVRPNWLGQEVTGDARYYNAQLAKQPFGSWVKGE